MKKTKSTPRATPRRCAVSTGSAARCPKCNGVGYYVRTRYFDGEAADVWECQSPQCTSFGLLWHVSRPYSDAENMARATQMTDAELVTHLRTMARIFDGQLAKWVLGVAAERIERHSSLNTKTTDAEATP